MIDKNNSIWILPIDNYYQKDLDNDSNQLNNHQSNFSNFIKKGKSFPVPRHILGNNDNSLINQISMNDFFNNDDFSCNKTNSQKDSFHVKSIKRSSRNLYPKINKNYIYNTKYPENDSKLYLKKKEFNNIKENNNHQFFDKGVNNKNQAVPNIFQNEKISLKKEKFNFINLSSVENLSQWNSINYLENLKTRNDYYTHNQTFTHTNFNNINQLNHIINCNPTIEFNLNNHKLMSEIYEEKLNENSYFDDNKYELNLYSNNSFKEKSKLLNFFNKDFFDCDSFLNLNKDNQNLEFEEKSKKIRLNNNQNSELIDKKKITEIFQVNWKKCINIFKKFSFNSYKGLINKKNDKFNLQINNNKSSIKKNKYKLIDRCENTKIKPSKKITNNSKFLEKNFSNINKIPLKNPEKSFSLSDDLNNLINNLHIYERIQFIDNECYEKVTLNHSNSSNSLYSEESSDHQHLIIKDQNFTKKYIKNNLQIYFEETKSKSNIINQEKRGKIESGLEMEKNITLLDNALDLRNFDECLDKKTENNKDKILIASINLFS